MKLTEAIKEMQNTLETIGDVDVDFTILSKENISNSIDKSRVIDLLRDYRLNFFFNVECDSCQNNLENLDKLIEGIENYDI